MYLLDTNVISHRKAKRPNISVLKFLHDVPDDASFLSVVTLMEIRYGIERLDTTSFRRARLETWLTKDIPTRFKGRIIPVTTAISDIAGRMHATERKAARTPHISDLLIAATAKLYGMQVATLNRKHFEPLGVPLADF